MAALPPNVASATGEALADLKRSISFLQGQDTRDMPDEILQQILDYLKRGGTKSDIGSTVWQFPKTLYSARPGYRTHFELEGRPQQKLDVWMYLLDKKQVLVLNVPDHTRTDGWRPAIIRYVSSQFRNANGYKGNDANLYEIWDPKTPPNALLKSKNQIMGPKIFRISQKDSASSSEGDGKSETTSSDPTNSSKRDSNSDTDSKPLAKRQKLNLTISSKEATPMAKVLEKTSSERPLRRSILPPYPSRNSNDQNNTTSHSTPSVTMTTFYNSVTPSSSAVVAPTKTSAPRTTGDIGINGEKPTFQSSEKDPIEVVDNGDASVKHEHNFHRLSAPIRNSISSDTTGSGHKDGMINTETPFRPAAVHFYGQSRTTTQLNTYENVSFLFYDIAGQRVGKDVPFHECNSARMLKDAAIEHDSITDDTRMFIIRIGQAAETKMRVDFKTSFEWKIIEPLNEIMSRDSSSKVVIHVSGMKTHT